LTKNRIKKYNGPAINPVFNYGHGPILGKSRVLKFSHLECFLLRFDYSENIREGKNRIKKKKI
jgi:hypothetical protein